MLILLPGFWWTSDKKRSPRISCHHDDLKTCCKNKSVWHRLFYLWYPRVSRGKVQPVFLEAGILHLQVRANLALRNLPKLFGAWLSLFLRLQDTRAGTFLTNPISDSVSIERNGKTGVNNWTMRGWSMFFERWKLPWLSQLSKSNRMPDWGW